MCCSSNTLRRRSRWSPFTSFLGALRARIASGLTHRALADRLGLKEQAVQRYEATDYASANFGRLAEVADALGVQIRQELHLPIDLSPATLVKRLKNAGVSTALLERRFLDGSTRVGDRSDQCGRLIDDVERVFGWSPSDLKSDHSLNPDVTPQLAASFKKPVNSNDESATAYVVYAHYLALQLASLTPGRFDAPPSDWKEMRCLLEARGEISLRTVSNYAWDIGIAVVPLQDRISIHGAFWNFGDRAAIVMKQGMRTSSRWLFDLLHELYHAATDPEGVVEDGDLDADAEINANQFAADVLLDGRAEELIEQAVREAGGQIPRLKRAAQSVAASAGVPVGVLANTLSWRLALQGEEWWGLRRRFKPESQIRGNSAVMCSLTR